LDPPGEPSELLIDEPERGEMVYGDVEIVAASAAAPGGTCDDPRRLVR
jgi:hypothetical protein